MRSPMKTIDLYEQWPVKPFHDRPKRLLRASDSDVSTWSATSTLYRQDASNVVIAVRRRNSVILRIVCKM